MSIEQVNRKLAEWKPHFWRHLPAPDYLTVDICWEWQSGLDKKGYGMFYPGQLTIKAHRAAWLIYRGQIGDFRVLHSCDNRRCVNPNHLFLGTQADNVKDMDDKNRLGSRYGKPTLTAYDVADIKRLLETESCIDLANRFNVKKHIIYSIRDGKRVILCRKNA